MARSPTTIDAFGALAEPARRQMLSTIARGGGEHTVSALVDALRWPQPRVSKHLSVLRTVNLVTVRRHGRERRYRVNGETMKSINDWTLTFERFWTAQLDRIKDRAERAAGAVDPSNSLPLSPLSEP